MAYIHKDNVTHDITISDGSSKSVNANDSALLFDKASTESMKDNVEQIVIDIIEDLIESQFGNEPICSTVANVPVEAESKVTLDTPMSYDTCTPRSINLRDEIEEALFSETHDKDNKINSTPQKMMIWQLVAPYL